VFTKLYSAFQTTLTNDSKFKTKLNYCIYYAAVSIKGFCDVDRLFGRLHMWYYNNTLDTVFKIITVYFLLIYVTVLHQLQWSYTLLFNKQISRFVYEIILYMNPATVACDSE
jgi:hypothetical protein